MAHLQPAPTSFNYFDPPPQQPQPLHYSFQQQQQPPHHQQQQQMQHQQQPVQQQRNGGMANSAHYALVQQQQQQQQLLGLHSTSTPGQSPYRQSQPSLPHSHHASPLMAHPHHSPQLSQQTQPQPAHAQPQPHPHQHPTRPMSGHFKRELFPHDLQQANQPQHGASAGGPSGLLQQRHGLGLGLGHGGLPPAPLSSKDSPPPNLDEYKLMEQNVRSITESPPPDQVANMLSQILAPNVANKFGQFAPPPQQSQTHQQQLYAHFGYGGPAQQAPKQHAYASPAASIQLSQHQAQLAQSNHFSRPPVQPAMQPQQQQPQQPSYYDQQASQPQQIGGLGGLGGGGGMSPYVPLQYPSSTKNGPPAQLSPSQIPGMANIVDPDYVRMLRERQRELHELQRNEANRVQMIKEQQMRQQQQQQQQQLSMGLGLGHFQQPPPPLQVRSQSLPDPQQFGNANHVQPTMPNYYSQGDVNPMALQQQQYRQDLASPPLGHQQPPPGSYPQSLLQQHVQPAMQQQHQQAQIGAYNQLQANSNQTAAGVAVPPGFKADGPVPGSNNNSPPFATRQQTQQQPQQSPSQYTQMQQLKQIVNGADGEFRSGAASPNLSSGPSARVPSAPLPRRSQSLGDPNGNGMGMGVGAQPPPVSHEAVPISLGGRRGGGGEGGERAAVGANLSRFACGPPHQESRGFVARCCTEARRGRASHAVPSSSSSVLTRASFGTRRSSKDMSLPSKADSIHMGAGGSSSHATLALYNPYNNLASSPELPDSSPPAPTSASSYPSFKPAPLSTASPAASAHATPCASPHRHPAPRARMHTPLLPPTPK